MWTRCTPSGKSPDLANPAAISIGGSNAWGGVVAQAIVAVTPRIWADLGFVSLRVAVFHPLPIRPLDGAIAWAFLRIPQTPARQTSQTETRMAILEINLLAVFPLFDTAARHRL